MIAIQRLCIIVGSFGLVTAKSHACPNWDQPDFGIGFSLSLDYATASVHFSNGSTIDIAKIEGSLGYKQVMRDLKPVDHAVIPMDVRVSRTVNKQDSQRAPYLHSSENFTLPTLLQNSIWPWPLRRQNLTTMEFMIKALKTTTESYLETPVDIADLAIPFQTTDDFHYLLNSASKAIGVRNSNPTHPYAGLLAALANGIGNPYYSHEPIHPSQLVLVVDYSRAALTMTLMIEKTCIFEQIGVIHDSTLGTAAMQRCRETAEGETCHLILEETVRRFLKKCLDGVEEISPKVVGALLVIGESAEDPQLNRILKKVIRDQYEGVGALDSFPIMQAQKWRVVDPIFAAARGMAMNSHKRQGDMEFC